MNKRLIAWCSFVLLASIGGAPRAADALLREQYIAGAFAGREMKQGLESTFQKS